MKEGVAWTTVAVMERLDVFGYMPKMEKELVLLWIEGQCQLCGRWLGPQS